MRQVIDLFAPSGGSSAAGTAIVAFSGQQDIDTLLPHLRRLINRLAG
jgi:hypothetical protein